MDILFSHYEATKTVVNNLTVTANNIREIGEKLALYCGTFFIVTGMLIVLKFGKLLFVIYDNYELACNTKDIYINENVGEVGNKTIVEEIN